jgi:hypothetical protein
VQLASFLCIAYGRTFGGEVSLFCQPSERSLGAKAVAVLTKATSLRVRRVNGGRWLRAIEAIGRQLEDDDDVDAAFDALDELLRSPGGRVRRLIVGLMQQKRAGAAVGDAAEALRALDDSLDEALSEIQIVQTQKGLGRVHGLCSAAKLAEIGIGLTPSPFMIKADCRGQPQSRAAPSTTPVAPQPKGRPVTAPPLKDSDSCSLSAEALTLDYPTGFCADYITTSLTNVEISPIVSRQQRRADEDVALNATLRLTRVGSTKEGEFLLAAEMRSMFIRTTVQEAVNTNNSARMEDVVFFLQRRDGRVRRLFVPATDDVATVNARRDVVSIFNHVLRNMTISTATKREAAGIAEIELRAGASPDGKFWVFSNPSFG